jgi:D-arabinose 1-dehydrogenase-like Zn-dependent alcohol dehydrogenase
MVYSTPTELRYATGVVAADYDDTTLAAIISYADAEIDAKLSMAGISGGSGNAIKVASLRYSTAALLTRMRMDGTKMKTLILDKVTMGDDIDEAIKNLRHEADVLVSNYIKASTTYPKYRKYVRVLGRNY